MAECGRKESTVQFNAGAAAEDDARMANVFVCASMRC